MTQIKRGRGRALATITIIAILVEIAREIQPCSVRALAYQLFNRKLIASTSKQDTQKVSRWATIAREEGSLPWEWIVDPTRQEQVVPTWHDPEAYGRAVQRCYRRNKWEAQPTHVSVWSEKATVEGTLKPVLDKYEVPFQVLHGWSGATPVWEAARANLGRDQDTLILYVGDYDPSGMGMSETDLPQRLARYSTKTPEGKDLGQAEVDRILAEVRLTIRRVALTGEDTQALGPATRFPAADKKKDSRHPWFVRTYGDWCWELDALSPNVLRQRVESAILRVLDRTVWNRYVHAEGVELEAIAETCRSWTSILGQVPKYPDGEPDDGAFRPGVSVCHDIYGIGRVVTVYGAGPDRRARVAFTVGGEMTFNLDHPGLPLRVV